jgi:LPS export ABC transporter protein LptC
MLPLYLNHSVPFTSKRGALIACARAAVQQKTAPESVRARRAYGLLVPLPLLVDFPMVSSPLATLHAALFLMKTRLRRMLMVIVLLLLGTVAGLVGRSLWQQSKRDVVTKGLEYLPGVSQHIQDFRRVKVQDGRKVWEVAAEDAQYFDDEKVVVVRHATLQWFLKDGRVVSLKGEEGRILISGREVASVHLIKNVEVQLGDYVVRVARADYDHQRGVISAPGAVEIVGSAVQLAGNDMEVDVQAQRLMLHHEVSMHVQPALMHGQGGDHAPL